MERGKFKNKYRIASARAPFWDYGWNAAYFVTICTQNRECWFGNVVNGLMDSSPIGHIANSCWHEIPNHFPFVVLGAHIVMPNHVHGMVIIDKPDDGQNDGRNVGTQNFASLQPGAAPSSKCKKPKNQFGPQTKNLASIVRGFKIGVTKNARQINPNFAWQPRYHDHIVRDDQSFERITGYIFNNPAKWREDKFYST